MILDTRAPEWDNKPRDIFDVNGNEIFNIVWCDTELGLVKQHERELENPYNFKMQAGDELLVVTKIYPAPLKVVLIDEKSNSDNTPFSYSEL